jgi:uncharacterized protein YjbI with pentapeptide repeats
MSRSLQATDAAVEEARIAMISKELTQELLAGKVEVSRATVGNFFGSKPIDKVVFVRICTILGLDWKKVAGKEVKVELLKIPLKKIFVSTGSVSTVDPVIVDKVKLLLDEITGISNHSKNIYKNSSQDSLLIFSIRGTINEADAHTLKVIIQHLRNITGDASIDIVDIQEGSIKLVLNGTPEALEQIQNLYNQGNLSEINGVAVEQVAKISELVSDDDFDNILDFSGADFKNAQLAGVDLSGANLENANLSDANLENANLNDANLENTNLRNANLKNANLSSANLKNANLSHTNLENANLGGANLENTKLHDANLENANLNGANLENTNLNGANVSFGSISNRKFINQLNYTNSHEGKVGYSMHGKQRRGLGSKQTKIGRFSGNPDAAETELLPKMRSNKPSPSIMILLVLVAILSFGVVGAVVWQILYRIEREPLNPIALYPCKSSSKNDQCQAVSAIQKGNVISYGYVIGEDSQGRSAEFKVSILSNKYRWQVQSSDQVSSQGSTQVISLKDLVPILKLDRIYEIMDNPNMVISVGTASCEGDNSTEEQRAEKRAEKIQQEIVENLFAVKYYPTLNLGRHTSDSCGKEPTEFQRAVIIIGVRKETKGIILKEALYDAISKRIKDFKLSDYSLGGKDKLQIKGLPLEPNPI